MRDAIGTFAAKTDIRSRVETLARAGKTEDAVRLCVNHQKEHADDEVSSLLKGLTAGRCYDVRFTEGGSLLVPVVDVRALHHHLGFEVPLRYPETSYCKAFSQWQMEEDDAPIFRYIYRQFQPRRHLEFGTWQGTGTVYCLEESAATVWTINLPFGETSPDGTSGYSGLGSATSVDDFLNWTRQAKIRIDGHRTDSFGAVGWQYLQRGLGHRVCQIYCDSRGWDSSNLPPGFFDTVLIDGGHSKDVVVSDTQKALPLVRRGGLIMWHDFCAAEPFPSTVGVMRAIAQLWPLLDSQMSQIFWVYPSWILVGVKK